MVPPFLVNITWIALSIAEGDPTLGPELFDVPEAEAEAMIKPDGIGNDLRGKAVATIWGRLCAHRD